ncbi:stability determinant [Caballeronia sp. J97]|uniref:type II toxin-antitoxin system RelB family antitoxin n=1 Tax=Caballeronia sp. J97 TaxID=2805429 RepID=UPI002AB219A9|nr:stability determinant [Caballeronia sp. J97]
MKREIEMPTPLDPIVSEFATVEEAEAHDKWFREKVRRSMADTRPRIPHDQVMAEVDDIIADAEKRHKSRAA